MSLPDDENSIDIIQCRVCLDECNRKDVIAPCHCSGSSKWIHRECLDKWRCTKTGAFSKCTECLYEYHLECISGDDTERASVKRQIRFVCYVIRDLFLALTTTQIVIFIFGLMAYLFDMKDHNLEKSFHFEKHPVLFYYLVGLVVVLAMVGMSYSCMFSNNCNGSTPCFCDCPYCFYFGPSDMPLCPAGCNCGSCNCAGVHCVDCACCNSCDGAGCLACDCSGAGAEVAGLALIVLAIFAFIGVFVSIFAGIFFTQYIVRKHLHFLGKRTMAEDYIVKDLASDALDTIRSNDISSFNPISKMQNSQRYSLVEGVEMSEVMHRGTDEEETNQSEASRDHQHHQSNSLSREHQLVLIRSGLL